jgi:SAM-dependent methyltransferase
VDIKELELLGEEAEAHWYYVSKGRAIRSVLGSTPIESVLDVGAGSGVFSRQLIDCGLCQRATCVDPAYSDQWLNANADGPLTFAKAASYQGEALVLMVDVLEHVDDDVGLLRQYSSRLAPGARVLITVPAYRFLWSSHDVFLEHRRRYTKAWIERVVRAAGLRVDKTRFFFALLFPAIAASRLFDRMSMARPAAHPQSALRRHSVAMNRLLIRVHDLERKVVLPVNRFFGLTIICLARSG